MLARQKSQIFYPATKAELAQSLGLARSSLYYQPKMLVKDLDLKKEIELVLTNHPSYGHKRIALELKLNKKRVLRVMKLFDLKPYRRRVKAPVKPEDTNKPANRFVNLIRGLCPIAPNVVWVADFTYLKYQGKFIYLATVMDLFTREIVGWNISYHHNKYLVMGALVKAFEQTKTTPKYYHSDQGSEYDSIDHIQLLETNKIHISMSHKSSPWENAFQESFYSQFKVDLGQINRFETSGELIEAILLTLYEYNHHRIHTILKMSPKQFIQNYHQSQTKLTNNKVKRIHSRV